MHPENQIAIELLEALAKLRIKPMAGRFAGINNCVGVHVRNAADATDLGMQLGQGYGTVGWEPCGSGFIIAFRDARVAA